MLKHSADAYFDESVLTTILFLDTQQSGGKSCSIGTMKVRQPSQ